LLLESNTVLVGIDFRSVLDIFNVLILVVVIGKRALVHAWRCNKISNWFFLSANDWTERSRDFCSSANIASVYFEEAIENE
jgi:hypothetical protein